MCQSTADISNAFQAAVGHHEAGHLNQAASIYLQILQIEPNHPDTLHFLGLIDHQLGNYEIAVERINKALVFIPNFAEAHYNLGVVFKDQGNLDKAVFSFQKALSIQPNFAEAYSNLGVALQAQGKLDEAVNSYQKAVALKPGYAEAHYNLGVAFKDQGKLNEAVVSYQKAVSVNPGHAEAHYSLGRALKDHGQVAEAIASYQMAVSLAPDYAEVHYNLGNVLKDQGQLAEAVASYQKAVLAKPDYAEAHDNLGNAFQCQGQLLEAVASYQKALSLMPDYAQAHYNLGNALRDLGQLDNAIASYRRVLEINPDYAEAYTNLANILYDIGQQDEAIANFRRALQIKPDFAEAHYNLGNALQVTGQLSEPMASYRRALEIKPDYAEAYANLGSLVYDMGQQDEAMAYFRRALEIKPDLASIHSNLLFAYNLQVNHVRAEALDEARSFGERAAQRAQPYSTWPSTPEPVRCLRVGLVSGDLGQHPVGYFLDSVLAALSARFSEKLRFYAYPSATRFDAVSERIKGICEGWRSAVGLPDETLARLIHEDKIDILIDLSGHTDHNRLPLFAWKPAPIQVSWLGYFATTGVAAMDYLIADPWTLPEAEEPYFTEKIWRMPETRLCFTPPEMDIDIAPLPTLVNGYVTFGCFNHLAKMNDTVVALWARILKTVPCSRLFLKAKALREASEQRSVIGRFAAHGVDADRLMMEGPEVREKYFSAYHKVDIALDPFPYTGGTTSVESLWMGVPVLTLAGASFLARQGVGLLMNAGLAEWVAVSADDYVARAVSRANDIQGLAILRSGLRHQVLASPIFDAPRFARHFEDTLRGMWQIWCKNYTDFYDE